MYSDILSDILSGILFWHVFGSRCGLLQAWPAASLTMGKTKTVVVGRTPIAGCLETSISRSFKISWPGAAAAADYK